MSDEILTMSQSPKKIKEFSNEKTSVPQKPQGKFGVPALTISILISFLIGTMASGVIVYFILNNQNNSSLTDAQDQYLAQISQEQKKLEETTAELNRKQTLIEQLQQTPTIPNINFENLQIKDGTETIYTQTDANINLKLLKQTAKNVYFYSEPDGLGGYILYRSSPSDFYRYNLSNKIFEKILDKQTIGTIEDISTDENLVIYKKDKKIYLYNLTTQKTQEFNVNEKYTQYGEIKFSPNAQKIAYAAAVGNPEAEDSAIFIIDIENNTTTKIIEGEKKVYHVKEWQGNKNSDLVYYSL